MQRAKHKRVYHSERKSLKPQRRQQRRKTGVFRTGWKSSLSRSYQKKNRPRILGTES